MPQPRAGEHPIEAPVLGCLFPPRRRNDINYLELLAATLALKISVKNKIGMLVLLKMDNTTAIAYINNRGGNCIQGAGVLKDVVSRKEHLYPSTTSARDNG